jgi:hypothetical protein
MDITHRQLYFWNAQPLNSKVNYQTGVLALLQYEAFVASQPSYYQGLLREFPRVYGGHWNKRSPFFLISLNGE